MVSFYGRRGIGLASVLALAVVILGVNLGLWQLRRAEEKASLQQAQDRAAAAPALELGAPAVADACRPPELSLRSEASSWTTAPVSPLPDSMC